jgi:hypothetical protein
LRARCGTERKHADMPGKNAAVLGICLNYSSMENADPKEKHENA